MEILQKEGKKGASMRGRKAEKEIGKRYISSYTVQINKFDAIKK